MTSRGYQRWRTRHEWLIDFFIRINPQYGVRNDQLAQPIFTAHHRKYFDAEVYLLDLRVRHGFRIILVAQLKAYHVRRKQEWMKMEFSECHICSGCVMDADDYPLFDVPFERCTIHIEHGTDPSTDHGEEQHANGPAQPRRHPCKYLHGRGTSVPGVCT